LTISAASAPQPKTVIFSRYARNAYLENSRHDIWVILKTKRYFTGLRLSKENLLTAIRSDLYSVKSIEK
jgi:hypothetical protein